MNKLELISAILCGDIDGNAKQCCPQSDIGKRVLIRTASAGVHFGTLESNDRMQVRLRSARRIWSWKGANTLNEIALRGIDVSASRVSEAVDAITLPAIEIIPLADAARLNLDGAAWKS